PNRPAISSSFLALNHSKYAATTSTSAAASQRAPWTGRQGLLILLATVTAQEGTEKPSRPHEPGTFARGRTPRPHRSGFDKQLTATLLLAAAAGVRGQDGV